MAICLGKKRKKKEEKGKSYKEAHIHHIL